jgi:histidine ammonia-lyase
MATVRITDASLTIEDSLAVANGPRVELAEGRCAKIADGRAMVDPAPAAGSALYSLTAQVGHGRDTRPGTASFG